MAYNLAAMDLWDDNAWFELASSQADLARSTGSWSCFLTRSTIWPDFTSWRDEFSLAAGLVSEAEALDLGVRAETLPYIPLRLAAWRGQAAVALNLVEVMMRGRRARGEGCAITAAEYADRGPLQRARPIPAGRSTPPKRRPPRTRS